MNLGLVRPCAKCPFRNDIEPFIMPGRAREIIHDLQRGHSFICHETLDSIADDDDDGERDTVIPGEKSQHCAGAMILLEKHGIPNQIMRIYGRLNGYDPRRLVMDSPVYRTFGAMVAAVEAYWKTHRSLAAKKRVTRAR